jgi:putative ABC transport system substrate-binding protein
LLSAGWCAAAALLATWAYPAEPVAVPRIGVLLPYANESIQGGLRQGLRDLGYVEGKNLVVDWKTAGADYQQLQALADGLIQSNPDVIVTGGDAASGAVVGLKTSIPVVFVSSDPVFAGYAKSLSHPGTNATGIYMPVLELEAKRLELLIELAPRARRVAYLRNPSNPLALRLTDQVEQAAKKLGVQLSLIDARVAPEVDAAIARVSKRSADAVLVSTDMILFTRGKQIVQSVHNARLPVVYQWRPYVDYGGLMSYGMNHVEVWHRAATYVDLILKGTKPTDLPIEEVSKFAMAINLREAQALRIDIPHHLLMRAEEVIR